MTFTILDSDGNEISHTVVQTMSVVEKGSMDEFLLLEGGGNVHMKLQFVLSEEERNRIRSMRESAMKKKYGELLNTSVRYSETASTAGAVVASSMGINNEVSDSQKRVKQNETVNIGDPPIHAVTLADRERAAGTVDETAFYQRQNNPNDTDGREETSSAASISKGVDTDVDVNQSKSVEKIETKLISVDVPRRPVFFQEVSTSKKKSLVASELKNDRADQPEKQEPLGKTPSNVRKMIGAFESSLAKDMRPDIKPPPVVAKSQSNKVGREAPLEEITKSAKRTSERLKNPFLAGKLQQITNEAKREEHVAFSKELNGSKSSQNTGQLVEPSTTQIQVKQIEQIPKPQEDLVRFGELQQIQTYKGKREEHIGSGKDSNGSKSSQDVGQLKEPSLTQVHVQETKPIAKNELRKRQEDLVRMSIVEADTIIEAHGGGIRSSDIQEHSEGEVKSAALYEKKHSSFESSGSWIFPDQARRLCITTGSKQAMELVEGCGILETTHEGKKSFSLPENTEKYGNYAEEEKDDETSHELRKSQLESPADVGTSDGLIGQAIKVAIMVAFGTLVLLTRQRKPRKEL